METLPIEIILTTVIKRCRFVSFRAANTDQTSAEYSTQGNETNTYLRYVIKQ